LASASASASSTLSLEHILVALVPAGNAQSLAAYYWIIARLVSELLASLLLLLSAVLLLLGKEKAGIFLGNLVLLLYLTMINLVVFYFDQFSTILLASVQFGLFLGLNSYNQRFVIPAPAVQAAVSRSHVGAG
jgi:glucose dehydrogenase